MSNIERRYAYLDTGVFPAEGEYGVTYLTLYSSNAGNTYDGWIYDPDGKVEESTTPRTYGYRNPTYPQYCWDDEVVVDLSNAQNRQESSEYEHGRITSFNTNVSNQPIILQDIDITGMTEEERENKATVVLFSAIPIVKDAYIQAQVEVQCKCNLSPNNTSGEMRVEAFYILNDESDRTMRPNPVHTFTVSSPNERHTLPWLYWNPVLKHEDMNYIGVKLIATGGTAEIGISDDPDYGDAMITLASGGLNGDIIYEGHPVSLEIFGKEEVFGGYVLDPDDYTVLCTYDTGEIYEVTRMCEFDPPMGTEIERQFTTLTAHYQGLSASMTLRLGIIEGIELFGVDTFHNKLKLKLSDYTVLAYLDTGDVMDVTGECVFSPPMGTTITSNTTLVATYTPYWMHGISFSDSMDIEKIAVVATGYNDSSTEHLIYTLYEDNIVVITGKATHTGSHGTITNENIQLPYELKRYVETSGYTLEWDAEGKVSGYTSVASFNDSGYPGRPLHDWKYLCKGFMGFDDVELTAEEEWEQTHQNYIRFRFYGERDLTPSMLKWCNNVDDTPVVMVKTVSQHKNMSYMFAGCEALTNLDFASNWNWYDGVEDTHYMFAWCISLKNINGLADFIMSNVTNAQFMFWACSQLETISGSAYWDVSSLEDATNMFARCESLINVEALWFWRPISLRILIGMFSGSGIDHASFLKAWPRESWEYITNIVSNSKILDLDGFQGLDTTRLLDTFIYFSGCPELINLNGVEDWILGENTAVSFSNNPKLTDISALSEWDVSLMRILGSLLKGNSSLTDLTPISGWDVSNIINFASMCSGCSSLENLQPLSNWRTLSAQNMESMFAGCDKVRYIGCLSGWYMLNVLPITLLTYGGVYRMFAHSNDDTPILDAGGLNWTVPTTAIQSGVEPLWKCSLFSSSEDSQMLRGTDLPRRSGSRKIPLSEKQYSLPYWYYHNDGDIDETR